MKAAFLTHYDKKGTSLALQEVPRPKPLPNQILVKVLAAGVNPLDNMIIRGEVRMIVPYKVPLLMGNEFVGTIEECGESVVRFTADDRVYARMPLDHIGTFCEYLCVDEKAASCVPDYLTDEQAACVPLTALTAQQAYNLMNAESGGTLYISGGTGSVGAMAIPLAAARGLRVSTSGNAASRDRVMKLGAETFVDYKSQDYTQVLHNIDYVLDTLGDKALPGEFEILREGGSLVSLRGMPNAAFARRMHLPWYKVLLFSIAGHKYDAMAAKKNQTYDFMFVHADGHGLEEISRVFEERRVLPSVDEVFPLDDINKALEKVARGGSKGKTVIRVG